MEAMQRSSSLTLARISSLAFEATAAAAAAVAADITRPPRSEDSTKKLAVDEKYNFNGHDATTSEAKEQSAVATMTVTHTTSVVPMAVPNTSTPSPLCKCDEQSVGADPPSTPCLEYTDADFTLEMKKSRKAANMERGGRRLPLILRKFSGKKKTVTMASAVLPTNNSMKNATIVKTTTMTSPIPKTKETAVAQASPSFVGMVEDGMDAPVSSRLTKCTRLSTGNIEVTESDLAMPTKAIDPSPAIAAKGNVDKIELKDTRLMLSILRNCSGKKKTVTMASAVLPTNPVKNATIVKTTTMTSPIPKTKETAVAQASPSFVGMVEDGMDAPVSSRLTKCTRLSTGNIEVTESDLAMPTKAIDPSPLIVAKRYVDKIKSKDTGLASGAPSASRSSKAATDQTDMTVSSEAFELNLEDVLLDGETISHCWSGNGYEVMEENKFQCGLSSIIESATLFSDDGNDERTKRSGVDDTSIYSAAENGKQSDNPSWPIDEDDLMVYKACTNDDITDIIEAYSDAYTAATACAGPTSSSNEPAQGHSPLVQEELCDDRSYATGKSGATKWTHDTYRTYVTEHTEVASSGYRDTTQANSTFSRMFNYAHSLIATSLDNGGDDSTVISSKAINDDNTSYYSVDTCSAAPTQASPCTKRT